MPLKAVPDPVSLIIPAYNEAERIADIVRVALEAEGLARILVVDDGSTDGTAETAREIALQDSRLSVVSLPTNQGKAGAMLAGVQAAGTDIVAFIDADLVGVQPRQIGDLVRPVLNGECDMTIALFRGGRLQTDLSHFLTPILSGQRCLRWSLFHDTPLLENARGGIEVALSLHAQRKGLRVRRVIWAGVTHVMKTEKMGPVRGLWIHFHMYAEILRYAARVRWGLPPRNRPTPERLAREPRQD